jgi:hypothetical protein
MGGKKLFVRTIFALLALPFATGQSCSSNGGGDDPQAILTACGNLAAVQCRYLATCLPIFMGAQFDDVDTCAARFRLSCEGFVTWPGVRWTAERFDQCAEQVKQSGCAAIDTVGTGPCSLEPGSLPTGAACVDSSQCNGGSCVRTSTSDGTADCGTCRQSGCLPGCKAGEGCLSSSEGSRCVAIQAEGTPCTLGSICAASLSCLDSICRKGRAEGESCTTVLDCDRLQELTCVDNVCRKQNLVDIGATCNGSADRCARGGTCRSQSLSSAPVCVAPIADGAPCGGDVGTNCTTPARCVSGICKLPAQMTCP